MIKTSSDSNFSTLCPLCPAVSPQQRVSSGLQPQPAHTGDLQLPDPALVDLVFREDRRFWIPFFFFPVRRGRQHFLVRNLNEPPSPRGSWMPPSAPRDEGTSKPCPATLRGGDEPAPIRLSPTSHLHPDVAALQAPKHR